MSTTATPADRDPGFYLVNLPVGVTIHTDGTVTATPYLELAAERVAARPSSVPSHIRAVAAAYRDGRIGVRSDVVEPAVNAP